MFVVFATMPAFLPASCLPCCSQVSMSASAAAAAVHHQLNSLHAGVASALLQHKQQYEQRLRNQRHGTVLQAHPRSSPGWLPKQHQQQQPGSFVRSKTLRPQQTRQRQLSTDRQQGQQPGEQLQQHQPPQSKKQQPFVWGYLDGDAADQWTWDDDYNEDAIARASTAARQLPPTPRQAQLAAAAAAAAQQRPTVITQLPEQFNKQVLSNALLLVDKPVRWSSTDVVRQLQMALQGARVCCGVPLDTEAAGLIILLLGSASRLTPKFEPLPRAYSGTFRLGFSTTTYDASGQTLEANPWQHITDTDIHTAAQRFLGEVQQIPCMWSSSKYKNKPLHWYAERGEVVARQPKAVHFTSIQTWRAAAAVPAAAGGSGSNAAGVSGSNEVGQSNTVHFRVVASKGASVRVLVHDLGKALGCGAHVTSLRREGIGGFSVDTAWSLDVLLPLARKYAKGFKHGGQS